MKRLILMALGLILPTFANADGDVTAAATTNCLLLVPDNLARGSATSEGRGGLRRLVEGGETVISQGGGGHFYVIEPGAFVQQTGGGGSIFIVKEGGGLYVSGGGGSNTIYFESREDIINHWSGGGGNEMIHCDTMRMNYM